MVAITIQADIVGEIMGMFNGVKYGSGAGFSHGVLTKNLFSKSDILQIWLSLK